MTKLNMCVFYKLLWAFAFVFAGFVSTSSAQEHTASGSGENSSPLIIESKQAQSLTERITEDLEEVMNCASSQQFLTSSGCEYLNETEPKTTDPFKANMSNCSGNSVPKWNGSAWYCATITVPKDCAGRVKLSECNTDSITLANGASKKGVSCMGYRGTCDADVTCNEGSYVIDREYCPAMPVNCFDSVGGPGCTAMHSLNHGKSGTWTCESGYTGECSAVCNNGNFEGNINTCQSTGAWTASSWSAWSACSATCGGGTQTRTRTVTCTYDVCTGAKPTTSESQSCNTQACPTTGPWTTGAWSSYDACSATCGGGTQTRTRTVTCSYDSCTGTKPSSSESKSCNTQSCLTWGMACPDKLCGPHTSMPNCPSSNPSGTVCSTNGALCDASTGRYTCGSGSASKHTFSWKSGSWGTCSKACNGTQTRTVTCNRDSDNKVFADSKCSGSKPATSQTCGTSCATTGPWTTGSWSGYGACSKTCGGGIQKRTRTVTCSYDSCTGSKPSTSQSKSCNAQACATTGPWTTGSWSSWSSCSKTCGGGTQTRTRTVTCSYDSCTGAKPSSSESKSCNTTACKSYSWKTGKWGKCSTSCGTGTQYRFATCEDNLGNPTPTSNCPSPAPKTNQSCTDTTGCPKYTYSWYTGSWGKCSKACKGTQSRTVYCRRSDGSVSSASNCSGTKPATSQTCGTACTTYSWNTGAWGACSKSCGGGTKTRSVTCKSSDGKTVSSTYCSGGKPSTSQSCNTQACATGGCTIMHPISWTTNGKTCVEYYLAPGGQHGTSTMANGSTATRSSGYCPFGGPCNGTIKYKCDNGSMKVLSKTCVGGHLK